MADENKCAYCGSTKNVYYNSKYGDYLCGKHASQVHRKGYCYKTIFEPNDYGYIDNNIAYIIAYRNFTGKYVEAYEVIVDADDLVDIIKYKWYIDSNSYVVSHNASKLHRLILNCTDKSVYVDHINHNKLDNRKCNLRIVTHAQNEYNRLNTKKSKSKFKGVYKQKNNYFKASGTCNKKYYSLGTYFTEIEAAYAYNLWAEKTFGEYACLNKFTKDELIKLQKLLPLKTRTERTHKSIYKYVYYKRNRNTWRYIRKINGINYEKDGFKTEKEAYNAYIERMNELGVEP